MKNQPQIRSSKQARMEIICGDCAMEMAAMATGSIDLVVTSPPYDALRSYNGFAFDFEATAYQIHRALKDGGVCCWNVGDSVVDGSETLTSATQKIFFRTVCGFNIHDTMIYQKANFSNPSSNRYHQVFEYIFVLSKGGPPKTWNPIKDKKNEWAGTGTFGKNTIRESNGEMGERTRNIITEYGMRGNVWRGKTRGQEDICKRPVHPAMMPKWLARDLILSWSNPGETVLDPMAGGGTSGVAAIETGRNAILIDCSPQYCELMHRETNVTPGLPFPQK